MVLSAVGLALFDLWLDEALVEKKLLEYTWVFTGSPEAARQILSTIASSIITVAALAFSMTMVSLTLASSQFGPRILRNFIRDTGNQLVLGTFLATYIYCLIVLRAVRGLEGHAFVPQIAISIAFLLLLTSIGVLIYFIHHVVTSIQADFIVDGISKELQGTICRIYPEKDDLNDSSPPEQAEATWPDGEQTVILSRSSGYLQTIDYDELLQVAVEFNTRFRIRLKPGQYVIQRQPLLAVGSGCVKYEEMTERVNQAFILGVRPTPTQDVEFSIDQLVEIAVRALSPGINDPFTAMACLDHLGNALALLFRRTVPASCYFDDTGCCRLFTRCVTMPGVIDAAFNQIRQYGRGSVPVMARMLETIAGVVPEAQTEEVREALYRQAVMIERSCQETFQDPYDRKAITERFQEVWSALTLSRTRYPAHFLAAEPEAAR